jgi:hypothetical protein
MGLDRRRPAGAIPRRLAPGIYLLRAYEITQGEVASMSSDPLVPAWRPYSRTTTIEKRCMRCGTETILPGKRGWWWRYQAPKEPGRWLGRTTESICDACFTLLPPPDATT